MIDLESASVRIDDMTLLRPTTLAVGRGETVALRGPNGAGKTTILRLIAGQIAPATGRVRVAGARPRPRDPAHRARVAGMIGLPPFARDLTVLEHATLVAITWGMAEPDARARATMMLDAAGLGDLRDRFPHELSSGQTQLAGLALTLVRPADVLLLDEPEQRLDPDRLARVLALLRHRQDDGATIVLATHSDDVVSGMSARTVAVEAA